MEAGGSATQEQLPRTPERDVSSLVPPVNVRYAAGAGTETCSCSFGIHHLHVDNAQERRVYSDGARNHARIPAAQAV